MKSSTYQRPSQYHNQPYLLYGPHEDDTTIWCGYVFLCLKKAWRYPMMDQCYFSFANCPSLDIMEFSLTFRSYQNTHAHTNKRFDSWIPSKVLVLKCPQKKKQNLSMLCLLKCQYGCCLLALFKAPGFNPSRANHPLKSKSPEWTWDSPVIPGSEALSGCLSLGPFLAVFFIFRRFLSLASTLINNFDVKTT